MKKFNVTSAIFAAVSSFAAACGVGLSALTIYNYYVNGIAICINPNHAEVELWFVALVLVALSALLAFIGIITDSE